MYNYSNVENGVRINQSNIPGSYKVVVYVEQHGTSLHCNHYMVWEGVLYVLWVSQCVYHIVLKLEIQSVCYNYHFIQKESNLQQTANFRLFHTERVCTQKFPTL